jgi:hypothetical protein
MAGRTVVVLGGGARDALRLVDSIVKGANRR